MVRDIMAMEYRWVPAMAITGEDIMAGLVLEDIMGMGSWDMAITGEDIMAGLARESSMGRGRGTGTGLATP